MVRPGPTRSVSRRLALRDGLLSAAMFSAVSRPLPSFATEPSDRVFQLGASVRGKGDAGLSSWNQQWSSSCSWSAKAPPPLEQQASLPDWLAGRWKIQSSIDGVQFPLGRSYVGEKMPGVRMASVLPLPNIGSTPTFEVEFVASTASGAVVPARGANAAATLQAFWKEARVVDIETPSVGRLLLRYESPTRSMGRVNQSVDLSVCASEGGPLDPSSGQGGDEWVTSEIFKQDNIEQGIRGEYQVLSGFSRVGTQGAVRCRQRVAAFLQPTDGAYFDALGKPVALYDYTFMLTRL